MTERESDTRTRRIDPKLEAAGWAVALSAQTTPETSLWPTALTEFAASNRDARQAHHERTARPLAFDATSI